MNLNLPRPTKTRWQTLRAGLVDIFDYDYQEFWFRDGRLLLRGNNGTGKSKVLALTLPFLFDGRTAPSRIEPDGDARKKMEWNLLMGNRYSERTGYSWLEFGRLRQDGSMEFFTIGCGMKAVKGRALDTWFFTTEQRTVQDFSLLDQNRRPLAPNRLKETLGEHAVTNKAFRYRQMVDDKLFQLGEERYDALINLLIQLRQPQLSKRPDEKALSKALTEALPPLDQSILSDVADAFRNLEAERQELEGLRETAQAVDEFRSHYRQYTRIAGRHRAAEVRSAQSKHEKISADLRKAQAAHETARQESEDSDSQLNTTQKALQAARVRERTLQQSPEMRDAQTLHQSEERAEEKQKDLAQATSEVQENRAELEQNQYRLEEQQSQISLTKSGFLKQLTTLSQLAVELKIDNKQQNAIAALQLPDGGTSADSSDERIHIAESAIKSLYLRRGEQLDHLKHLNRQVEQTTDKQRHIHERWQEACDYLEQLAETQLEAETQTEQLGQTLVNAFIHYCDELRELKINDPDALAESLKDWTLTLDGDNPVTRALTHAFKICSQQLADEQALLNQQRSQQQEVVQQLLQEKTRLESGKQPQPPASYTRETTARLKRPGAPLWKLIDFHDHIDAQTKAAVEAALEAAGLLDAWLQPDGSLLDRETWDTVLIPCSSRSGNLTNILKPMVDRSDTQAAAISDPTLSQILDSIGWGASEHFAWIDEQGQWRLGPLQGRWNKTEAEYIGHGAREAARHRRLEALTKEISAIEQILFDLNQKFDRIAGRRERLDQEWKTSPSDEPLRQAHQQVANLMTQKQLQQEKVDRESQRLSEVQQALEHQRQQRDLTAQDLDLPIATDALATLESQLNNYRAECHGFWPSLRHYWGLLKIHDQLQSLLKRQQQRLAEKQQRLSDIQRIVREALALRDTLRETLGDAVAVVEQKLAEASNQIQRLENQVEQLHQQQIDIAKRLAASATSVASHSAALLEHNQTRRRAINRLVQFVDLGMLAAALPELTVEAREGEWPIEQAVQLARNMEKQLQQVDDSDKAWQSQQRQLHERISELQNALSRWGHEASAEQNDDLIAVRVVFQSQRCDTETLAQRIADTIKERRELLDAKEQELLEEHLINELAGHLQSLIQDAELSVNAMNDELTSRPTSTGMKLQLKWKPLADGETWLDHTTPDGLNTARQQLLRQSADVWSPQDRRAVGTFLKKQIDDARIAEETSALQEVMARALDYRYWHRFVVERWQDGAWRPAYGPASGGERVLVVTIPLFAAASSHYTSAQNPHAPRLVLLDEAFAGVDDDSRAKSLGLLAQFDMDVAMTSEREWGCYEEVPGIAIAQLTRREGVDAVHVGHWWWDGKQRKRATEQIPDLVSLEALA
jgi:uncharacterized protein (TIGR02680 family)